MLYGYVLQGGDSLRSSWAALAPPEAHAEGLHLAGLANRHQAPWGKKKADAFETGGEQNEAIYYII